MKDSELLTVPEVCKLLDISRATLYRKVDAGKLQPIRQGRQVYFDRQPIEEQLQAERIAQRQGHIQTIAKGATLRPGSGPCPSKGNRLTIDQKNAAKSAILEHLADGNGIKAACSAAGISYPTFWRLRDKDRTFADAVSQYIKQRES